MAIQNDTTVTGTNFDDAMLRMEIARDLAEYVSIVLHIKHEVPADHLTSSAVNAVATLITDAESLLYQHSVEERVVKMDKQGGAS